MSAIQATSAGVKDMADGSLRITFEFAPRYAKEAYSLFGARGTSCAVAALTQAASIQAAQQEAIEAAPEPKTRAGQLCVMACTFCADLKFQEWADSLSDTRIEDEKDAKSLICAVCGIKSRKELDADKYAATRFHTLIREPFLAWRAAQ